MPVPGRPQPTVSMICSRVSSVLRSDSASPPYPPPPLPCHLWQPTQLPRLNTALPASVGSLAEADCACAAAVNPVTSAQPSLAPISHARFICFSSLGQNLRSDGIGTKVLNFCLTRFPDANRHPLRSKTLWTTREASRKASR